MSQDEITIETDDRVAYVTLNRESRRNAISEGLIRSLLDTLDRIESDPSTWIVVLTGAGDKSFCAGRDLKEMRERDTANRHPFPPMRGVMRNVYESLYEFGKPTIAAINGWALGGGLELAMACDLRVAAQHARLGMPESRRGLGANFGAQILSRLVSDGIAREMLYFGNDIDADEALAIGLVNRVFPSESFREDTRAYVSELVKRAPLSHRRIKATLRQGKELPLSAALRMQSFPDPYTSHDRTEGVNAFLEKREPRWSAT